MVEINLNRGINCTKGDGRAKNVIDVFFKRCIYLFIVNIIVTEKERNGSSICCFTPQFTAVDSTEAG